MIKRDIGAINGKKITLFQCTTQEEVKEHGQVSFWESDGVRINDPSAIRENVMNAVKRGTFVPDKMASMENAIKVHGELMENRRKVMIENYREIRDNYKNAGAPVDAIDNINRIIKKLESENVEIMSIDGMVRSG